MQSSGEIRRENAGVCLIRARIQLACFPVVIRAATSVGRLPSTFSWRIPKKAARRRCKASDGARTSYLMKLSLICAVRLKLAQTCP